MASRSLAPLIFTALALACLTAFEMGSLGVLPFAIIGTIAAGEWVWALTDRSLGDAAIREDAGQPDQRAPTQGQPCRYLPPGIQHISQRPQPVHFEVVSNRGELVDWQKAGWL